MRGQWHVQGAGAEWQLTAHSSVLLLSWASGHILFTKGSPRLPLSVTTSLLPTFLALYVRISLCLRPHSSHAPNITWCVVPSCHMPHFYDNFTWNIPLLRKSKRLVCKVCSDPRISLSFIPKTLLQVLFINYPNVSAYFLTSSRPGMKSKKGVIISGY